MLEKHPFVSIIIATYNAAALLPQTLTSLRSMADFPFELLIADGGSTDDTLSIIEKNKDMIVWFKSEKDNGVYDACKISLDRFFGRW
jgi:glycosyltransferase involved in cell wall biosynthesis